MKKPADGEEEGESFNDEFKVASTPSKVTRVCWVLSKRMSVSNWRPRS